MFFISLSPHASTLSKPEYRYDQQLVELRYVGGLNEDEVAEVIKVSPRTVRSDWSLARAWLYRELSSGVGDDA